MVKLFTPEYKKQCVDMVLDGKHSVTQVCKMMRVSQSALNRWRRQFLAEQQGITPTAPAISAEQRETQRLWAKNEQLRSDNALLKEVSTFLLEKAFPRQFSRCFSLNRTTSHRWEKSPTNQIKAKVGRKQAVYFAENIANEQCAMTPNTLWAGDITYIPTDEGWLYLAVVIDWFSRLIVGWSVSDTPDSRLCIQALQLAIHRRKPPSEVIFHSDRGSQYSSQAFRNVLTEAKMVHSQSRAGKCTDNAVTERFFRSLKSEKLNGYRFKTREQALLCVAEYIEDFYNPRRLHSALGNRAPMQFEMDCLRT